MKIRGLNTIRLQHTNDGVAVTNSAASYTNTHIAASSRIKANMPTSFSQINPSNQVKLLEGFLPDFDTSNTNNNTALYDMYEDIYLHDAICGGTVDFLSTIPFGNFTLTCKNAENTELFERCVRKLRLRDLMPLIAADYLVYGTYVGSLNFNRELKYYDFLATHDLRDCEIEYPPVENVEPIITVDIKCDWSNKSDEKYKHWQERIPGYLQKDAKIVLSPMSTLYAARNTSATQQRGVSLYDRVLPVCLFEKFLLRGTIARAGRRLSPITHIQVGNDTHVPTDEELSSVADMFAQLDADPIEAIVATRDDVSITDVKNGSDFWKWDDVFEMAASAKYRALGISEDLLNGSTTLANMEANMSFLLEKEQKLRYELEQQILKKSIFENIALVNNLECEDGEYINGKSYDVPEITWEDTLTTDSDEKRIEMLDKLAELDVPVPLRMYAAAGNIDIDKILTMLEEDKQLRKKLGMSEDDSDSFDASFNDDIIDMTASKKPTLLSRLFSNRNKEHTKRYYGLHDRDTAGKRRYENGDQQMRNELEANRQIVQALKEVKKKHD